MQVITTHLNADFDGLASMIGASKLHPEAILAFSGSQEKKLREYIADNLSHQYDFIRLKNIDLAKVTGLIVVDTRVKKRIGPFGKCLDNPGLKLYLYDHHPSTADDMKGDVEEIQLIGSTTTLMTRLLRDRQFEISSGEATLFCLGIYEDTGSLSHLTTKPEDLRQAAWLLEHGAELDVVSQFISYELTGHQVNLLHELMKSTRLYTINNITVVVVTLSLDHYEDDFSLIVRRYMVMENLDNLFALVCMAGRIYLICRSRISEVNVGNIARDMGGGGHATAASATVHGMTIIEAQDKLIRTLHRHMRPSAIAGEMMSKTVITVFQSATIEEAHTLMTRYAINSIPVSDQDKSGGGEPHIKTIKGIVRKIDLERAIRHKLGHLQVSEYMNEDFSVLPKSAALSDIEELIIDRRQRLIPIVHEDVIIGVITRTDLLNMLVNDPSHLPKNLHHESNLNIIERVRNLNALIVEVLDRDLIILLRKIGEIAEKLNYQAVAVGGFVRDLLLKQENLDLDIVVDGNGIKFGELLVAQLGGHLRPHERFLTANITLADGFKIDVATARLEYYEYPAALPTVELSSIKLDLYRRDFTINAMALQLNPAVFGTLLDFFGCQADLKDRSIKVLHNLSFVEDPTRIFRAIRFEKRMEFGISAHTSRLIHSAVKMNLFNKVNDPRYFTELKLIFSEENPIPSIMRLADFNLFQFLWPDLKPHIKIDRRFVHILTQAHRAISWYRLLYLDKKIKAWKIYLLAVYGRSRLPELEKFCDRFNLPEKRAKELLTEKYNADRIAAIFYRTPKLSNSFIHHHLQILMEEGLLYLMAIARRTEIRIGVSRYVTKLRQVRTILNGSDLTQLGYQPGPNYKEMLEQLLGARLDGYINTKEEEIDFILKTFPLPQD